ncbi:hypothetical protein IEQ34_002333 [Dendrobium chrysotoxum]|uniref:NusG-like N-terminal domain-containing protein n=1 Tax=Dendrobium chrysotoxum TaxID=161865 RepID=A0AAV7HKF1_DENCH|nr:hypothetical protein IEQ34_002333 [Dendrobium chrysotoxum]
MLQGLSLLSIQNPPYLPPRSRSLRISICCSSSTSTSPESLKSPVDDDLSARERRQLRNERRERNATVSGGWREEVEERLARRQKKEYSSWKEKLNLDNLAKLGPRWWTVRVARVNGQETADRLARVLARAVEELMAASTPGFLEAPSTGCKHVDPDGYETHSSQSSSTLQPPFTENSFDFIHISLSRNLCIDGLLNKVYFPAVREKKKLKNGSYSEKTNPLFPGCVFLECVLNKEVHDYIRECDGVGGFLGSKVGNTKRQINKPKPVAAEEMENIFQQAKEEQQNFDRAFQRKHQDQDLNFDVYSRIPQSKKVTNAKGQLGKDLVHSGDAPLAGEDTKFLVPGATVRILSGPFVEFTGRLRHLDYTNKKATVGFTLFGKESYVDLDLEQIAVETNDDLWSPYDASQPFPADQMATTELQPGVKLLPIGA